MIRRYVLEGEDEFTIELESGPLLYMRRLYQARTYERLMLPGRTMDAFPTIEINAGIIRQAVRQAGKFYKPNEPYLIPPVETFLEEIPYAGGPYSFLPAVTCAALFTTDWAVRDKSKNRSWLVIVWFQPKFALPIEPDPLNQVRTIDWESVAYDED